MVIEGYYGDDVVFDVICVMIFVGWFVIFDDVVVVCLFFVLFDVLYMLGVNL